MQVHVGWLDDGTAVFSFRGTATVQDGLADVQIMHRDVHYMRDLFPGSRAHLGKKFWKQAGPAAAAVASACAQLACCAARDPTAGPGASGPCCLRLLSLAHALLQGPAPCASPHERPARLQQLP